MRPAWGRNRASEGRNWGPRESVLRVGKALRDSLDGVQIARGKARRGMDPRRVVKGMSREWSRSRETRGGRHDRR